MIRREGADPIFSAKFYRMVVQEVLLFGSETWVLMATFLASSDGDEGSNAEELDLETVGGREGSPGSRDQTSLVLHQQEAGDDRRVGGPTANIQGFCKVDGIRGRGEVAQTVASDGCGTAVEDHAKRYFGSRVIAAEAGIWQVW